MTTNPQDPYASFMVSASAGAGKTYQLSHRFLYLVGAGAQPENIVTITFTKKAAAEMRARIIEESTLLIKSSAKQQEFKSQQRAFAEAAAVPMASLLPPEDTGALILARTQALQINTIDSLFLDWVSRFKFEASAPGLPLPQNFAMPTATEQARLNLHAWEKTLLDYFESLGESFELAPYDAYNRVAELNKSGGFYWLCQQFLGKAERQFPTLTQGAEQSLAELVGDYEQDLKAIAAVTKAAAALNAAIEQRDVAKLQALRLLTAKLQISGSTIRGKKREQLAGEIGRTDAAFARHLQQARLRSLNRIGQQIHDVYAQYVKLRDRDKFAAEMIEFNDLSQAAFRLFAKDEAVGARYLIQRKTEHLMLDEFQDTSRLQWSIFRSIILEMLSGQGIDYQSGLDPSLFIVGDPKQSIYGFREADAAIMAEAATELNSLGVVSSQLNHSYRTCQVILDLVNSFFSAKLDDFPHHETARIGGQPVVEDIGSVSLAPAFEGEESAVAEAEFIAAHIHEAVKGGALTIYDKKAACLRPLGYQDCVVLYRAGTHSDKILDALRARGIPARREESKGYFQRQEIRDCLALLRFIADPNDLLSFLATLNAGLLPFLQKDFITWLRAAKKRATTKPAAYELVLSFLGSQSESQKVASQRLTLLLHDSPSLAASTILGRCFSSFQIPEILLHRANPDSRSSIRDNLEKLYQLFYDLQSSGKQSLREVLQHLNELAAEDSLASAPGDPDAVTLMTIHKSKGLEYPLVCVSGLINTWQKDDPYWIKMQQGDEAGFYYRGTRAEAPEGESFYDRLAAKLDHDAKMENLRLLYVALTRAQYHLLLTGHRSLRAKAENDYFASLEDFFTEKAATSREVSGHRMLTIFGKQAEGLSRPALKSQTAKAPVQALEISPQNLPSSPFTDLKTLAPAKLLSESDQIVVAGMSQEFAPAAKECGIYIHKILELSARGEPVERDSEWQKIVPPSASHHNPQLFTLANRDVDRVLGSTFWQFLTGIDQKWLEKEIVYIDQGQLIRGIIDLVLWIDASHAIIIDYKSTSFIEGKTDEAALIKTKGYDRQLQAYVAGLRKLQPNTQFCSAVLFTRSAKLHYVHQEFSPSGF